MDFLGFFKKFSSQKENIKEVSISEEIQELNLEIKKINEGKDYKNLFESLLEYYLKVRESVKMLKEAEKNEEIDSRLKSSADNMKNHFVNVISPLFNEDILVVHTITELNTLLEKISSFLELSKVINTDKGIIINAVYGKQMENLSSSLQKLALKCDDIKLEIKENNYKINEKKSTLSKLNEIRELLSSVSEIKKQEDSLKDKNETLSSGLEEAQKKINLIEGKKEYLDIKSKIMILNEKKEEIKKINDTLDNETSIINKVIKKYAYEKKEKGKFLLSGRDFLIEKDASVLIEIKNLLEKGSILLKQKQKNEVLDLLNKIISGEFDEPLIKIKELETQAELLEKEINENPDLIEKKELEKRMERITNELELLKKEKSEIENKSQRLSKQINTIKKEIEEKIGKTMLIN